MNSPKQTDLNYLSSWHRMVGLLVCFLLSFQPTIIYATAVGDGSTQTTIDTAANGIEVVNIAPVNSQGVSVNNYSQFDVDPTGMVINNSDKVGVSQLAGALYGNPNFNKNMAAQIILNQVTSSNQSNLNGATEIFGQKATYILANANGINVQGASFINTNRVDLITGTARFDNGQISDFDIGSGKLVIDAKVGEVTGLEASGASYVNLVSRIHRIRANLISDGDLSFYAGNSQYDFNTQEIRSLSPIADGNTLAINAIGSMYAGSIRMVATEDGLGVKTSNDMVSTVGDLSVDASGDVEYQNVSSANNIDISATNITQKDLSYSLNGNISLNARENLEIEGSVIANNHLSLSAQGNIGIDSNSEDSYIVADIIDISAGNNTLINSAAVISNQINLTANQLDLSPSSISATRADFNLNRFINHSELIIDELILNTNELTNASTGKMIDTQGSWQIQVNQTLNNQGVIWKNSELTLNPIQITNSGTLMSVGLLTINSQSLTNNQLLASEQSLSITANQFNNSGKILALNDLTIQSNQLTQSNLIQAQTINLNSATVDSNGIFLADEINFVITNQLSQQANGTIYAKQSLDLSGTSQNLMGNIFASDSLNLSADDLTLSSENIFGSNGDIALSLSGNFVNEQDQNSNGNLTINANSVDNQAKLAFENIEIDALSLTNGNSATLYGRSKLDIDVDAVDLQGTLQSDSILLLDVNQGLIDQNFNFVGGSGNNQINLNGHLDLSQDLETRGNLTINAEDINTNGNMLATENNLNINANNLHNQSGGFIFTGGNMNLDVVGAYNYLNSEIYSSASLDIHKTNNRNTTIYNQGGFIESAGAMNLKTATLTNIYSGSLSISKTYSPQSASYRTICGHWAGDARGYACTKTITENLWSEVADYNYDQGVIVSNQTLTLDVGLIDNNYSTLRSNQNISLINVDTINNASQSLKEQYWLVEYFQTIDDNYRCKRGIFNTTCHQYIAEDRATIEQRETNSKIGGSISAAGSISGNVSGIDNGVSARGASVGASQAANFSASNITIASIAVDTGVVNPLDLLNAVDSQTGNNINPDTLRGGFQLTEITNPDQLYLIESRTSFTDTAQFMASEYFLNRMGYDPHLESVKIFTDAFTEERLITDMIEKLTDNQFLNEQATSMSNQIQLLLDAAVDYSQDLDLTVGMKITSEQLAQLTNDIIWYETEIVNGEDVLVPKLYLTEATKDKIKIQNGALIIADEINLAITGDLNNSGEIYSANNTILDISGNLNNIDGQLIAGNTFYVDAQNIINQTSLNEIGWFVGQRESSSLIQAENLILNSRESIDNIGATLKANQDAIFNSNNLNNTTTSSSKTFSERNKLSKLDAGASIEANNLQINTNNFSDTAGSITANQDFNLRVYGNASFNALELDNKAFTNEADFEELNNRLFTNQAGFEVDTQTITNQVSQLDVSGNTQIITDGKLTLIGSQLNFNQDAEIFAKQGLTQTSVVNSETISKKKVEHSSGFLSSKTKTTTTTQSTQTNQSSTINTQAKLTIESEQEINLIASMINANQGTMRANQFNLTSSKDTSSYYKSVVKTGGFLKIGDYSETTNQFNQNNIKTELIVDTQLNIDTIKTKLIASKIKAKTIDISTEALELISDKDTSYYAKQTDQSSLVTRKINNQGKQTQTEITSTIEAQIIKLNNQELQLSQANIKDNIKNNLIKQLSSDSILTDALKAKGINLQSINLDNQQWNESITTLSAAGSLIVSALTSYFTAGMGTGLVEASNQALQVSIDSAINSLINQATSQLATSLITGQAPSFDIESMVKGAVMAGVSSYSLETFNPEGINKVLTKATIGGVGSELTGGNFKDGFIQSGVIATAGEIYQQTVGFEPQGKGEGVALKEDGMGAVEGVNNVGLANTQAIIQDFNISDEGLSASNIITDPNLSDKLGLFPIREGSPISNFMNKVPLINDTAGLHDSLFKEDGLNLEFNTFNNVSTMLPAALVSFGAVLDTNPTPIPMLQNFNEQRINELINQHNQRFQNPINSNENSQ